MPAPNQFQVVHQNGVAIVTCPGELEKVDSSAVQAGDVHVRFHNSLIVSIKQIVEPPAILTAAEPFPEKPSEDATTAAHQVKEFSEANQPEEIEEA